MNRRQKIIVSVVGIFIVLLALVGITYGYFLTRIQGNTNTTSITVTTADLKLVYGDGNGNVSPSGVIMPDNNNFITFSNNTDTKTFTVTNDGNTTVEDYVVVVEDINVTYASNATLEDGTTVTLGQATTFNRPEDFVYVLTCKAYTGYGTENQTELADGCNGKNTETVLPMKDSILLKNNIEEDVTHAYELKIKYLNPNVNQSKDMNKTFTLKVNIYDGRNFNPYSDNTSALNYSIINNAIKRTNGTELLASPKTEVAVENGGIVYSGVIEDNVKIIAYNPDSIEYVDAEGNRTESSVCTKELIGQTIYEHGSSPNSHNAIVTGCDGDEPLIRAESYTYENILSIEEDDYGISYYYRGDVTDNYLTFANKCWRIVRIEGDGSIKLLLEDQDEPCSETMDSNFGIYSKGFNYGYSTITNDNGNKYVASFLNPTSEADNSMIKALYDFQTDLGTNIEDLKVGNWCLGDLESAYSGEYNSRGEKLNDSIENLVSSDTYFLYDTYKRIAIDKTSSLKCNGTSINKFNDVIYNGTKIIESKDMYVGTLTADEVIFAGERYEGADNNFNFYLSGAYETWWTLSLAEYGYGNTDAFHLDPDGLLYDGVPIYDSYNEENPYYPYVRPSVSLKSTTEITKGNGSISSPYEITTN